MISLTPFPQSIALTIEETLKVLQDFAEKEITIEEFEEAKKPFVAHMSSNLFKNHYWLSQMEYMQVWYLNEEQHPRKTYSHASFLLFLVAACCL